MIWTIVISLLGILFIVAGLAIPSNWHLIQPNERGFVMLFGKVTNHRGPGIVHAWPWEEIIIRPISQIKGDLAVKLTTGGRDADEFTLQIPFIYHIIDVEKSVFAYRGDLNKGLEEFVQAAFQETLIAIGGHAILDGSLPTVVTQALTKTQEIADKWGIMIDSLKVRDVNLSESLQKRIHLIREAEGQAEAVRLKSAAEIDAYNAEVAAQGYNYRFHQVLDTMQQMAASGAFKYVGDLSSMLGGLAVIEEGELKK